MTKIDDISDVGAQHASASADPTVSAVHQSFSQNRAIFVLVCAQIMALSLWFVSAALIPELEAEFQLGAGQQAALSSAVQGGFVVGALVSAALGLADRFDPRRLFCVAACSAALANISLLWLAFDGPYAVVMRAVTGAALAGVYPIGIKLAAGWSIRRRGLFVGWLVAALTLGSALPHLIILGGGSDWQMLLLVTSVLAGAGGLMVLYSPLGPHLAAGSKFQLSALQLAWRDHRLRAVFLGYFGHMVELYAFWAWLGVALLTTFQNHMSAADARFWSSALSFSAIAIGAIGCVGGGLLADRLGKAVVANTAMLASGSFAVLTGLSFAGPLWLTALCVLLWGLFVIPDSPQFSALVADIAPASAVGSLLTLQTAIGFLITLGTVQAMPFVAAQVGWSWGLALLALGPCAGLLAMRGLKVQPVE